MRRKGRLQEGADADITLFDPARVHDTAGFGTNLTFSRGIRHVLVAGTPVVNDGATVRGVSRPRDSRPRRAAALSLSSRFGSPTMRAHVRARDSRPGRRSCRPSFEIPFSRQVKRLIQGTWRYRLSLDDTPMPVFMKDVAERAAVSLTTASLVLSGKKRISISPETRRRVFEAARELNYHPNEHARRLAQRSSNTFGLIVSEIANPFFPEIIQGFEAAAKDRGFTLLLCNTEYDLDRAADAVRKMIENKVRGVAVVTSKFERSLIRELTAQRIPVVVLDRSLAEPRTASVVIDFEQGLRQAIDHLLNLGHRRFAAITGPHSVPSALRYKEILVRLLAERQVQLQTILECNYKLEGGMEAVRSLVKQAGLPTAIFCGNDLVALGAISVLQQMGVRVPEDISVVGFDDIVFARLATPPLTTVAVPRQELGRTIFDALSAQGRTSRKPAHRTVTTELVTRASTARPRSRQKSAAKEGDGGARRTAPRAVALRPAATRTADGRSR